MQLKYVRYIDDSITLFSCGFNHCDIAKGARLPVKSAGFCIIDNPNLVVANGMSDTLGVQSIRDDADAIKKHVFEY